MRKYLAMALVILVSTVAHAGDGDGRGTTLLHNCQALLLYLNPPPEFKEYPDTANQAGMCIGIVHGTRDMAVIAGWIPPQPHVTMGESVQMVVKYLKDHPEQLGDRDTLIILRAMGEAYPLKQPSHTARFLDCLLGKCIEK
jgi:hypothetical protein